MAVMVGRDHVHVHVTPLYRIRGSCRATTPVSVCLLSPAYLDLLFVAKCPLFPAMQLLDGI